MRARQETSKSLVDDLAIWLQAQRGTLSRSATVAKPIDYMLKRWDRFAAFLEDGRICLTNNAAERALRGFALGPQGLALCGLRSRCRARCRHGDTDRGGQAQRH